ncbi:DNA-packaging protein [Brevundimonas goettingensis]|uniref:DNA-packaging protein n=1 Tax=Brevundimonas goettingensis TaxID=2774190 RepID=A0A975GWB3_9CAUL|nr:DNA-packaging protein [Brevundimonas goettingensis]
MKDSTPKASSVFATSSWPAWMLSQPRWSWKAWSDVPSAEDLGRIERDWNGWRGPAQTPPETDWTTWLFLGGRGAGKTRAGAEWLNARAVKGARLALVGPTLHDVREVMIEGPSGLRAVAAPGDRPTYHSSRRLLTWPSGARAFAFSAEDPESLRGPQFHGAWADEFCAWRNPGEVLAMLRLGLRLGDDPRLMVTTTPKPSKALKALIAEAETEVTRAGTAANAVNLSSGFLGGLRGRYGQTRLEAQEIEGRVLDDAGGLWSLEMLNACRGAAPERFDRVVVGVDPPATSHGDACGIVVAGRLDDRAYVLADLSVKQASPLAWAEAATAAARTFGADRVIVETNQGGEMVGQMLAFAGCKAVVTPVFARTSKTARAEPVALLYEKGRVTHCGALEALEDEMMALGSGSAGASPDRADALVWAISHLMQDRGEGPRIRRL